METPRYLLQRPVADTARPCNLRGPIGTCRCSVGGGRLGGFQAEDAGPRLAVLFALNLFSVGLAVYHTVCQAIAHPPLA
jgi:hypothetical protein